MGVPKFCRYICERYPCLLELVNEYEIPEFDNLYLDMNGIVHCCSHPNNMDAHFRITEEDIFKNIFQYVEILFNMIKPRKVFFMAVDGVAPRAKINQQRGRRFRAAKDADLAEAKARERGEEIPKEARFDSNCITPGTLFMARLTEQLKYFVAWKISTNELWKKCKVVLSGPEVPGEGEHKIMDYIRYAKSQPDHDPNTRHCLYGLDADLIILSLATHEPHFAVLREEVKYGKQKNKNFSPEKTRFCLLHVSLLREYMEHEFSPIRDKLKFNFDIEKIIDDWILMGFLVGNDFIPNLPNLHIENDALSLLYQSYMEVLPTLDGYINEAGTLMLDRFEKFMEKLSVIDTERFAEHSADLKYFEAKTGRRPNENERTSYRNKSEGSPESLESPKKSASKALDALIQYTDEMLIGYSDEEESLDGDSDTDTYNMEFIQHKRDYYMNKFEYENVDAEVLRSQAEAYVTAIQWNLNYYYNGCCSWSWFYPHHYAPYISDVKNFKDFKIEFELAKPFLPFQQLLAVLPAASRSLLPEAYQGLLTEKESPIIDYYPEDFKTDLNEKKQEWEAVVLIPFIDEKNLLDAMEPYNAKLTSEERKRNEHGPMYVITYTPDDLGVYEAPDYFPSVRSHARMLPLERDALDVPRDKLIKGLCKGVKLSTYFAGFPTFQHIKHSAAFEKAKVRVFEQTSRRENMIISIVEPAIVPNLHDAAGKILGKIVFVGWPHMREALVVGVSTNDRKITLINLQQGYSPENVSIEYLNTGNSSKWKLQCDTVSEGYMGRFGIDIGETMVLVYAVPMVGRQYLQTSHGRMSLEKIWSKIPLSYACQAIVSDISVHDPSYTSDLSISDVFSVKSIVFMLGHPHYGAMGEVIDPGLNAKTGRVKVAMRIENEPNLDVIKKHYNELEAQWMTIGIAAQRLGISNHFLSRVTGTIYVSPRSGESAPGDYTKRNIGLNLKFTKRNEEVPGYTKKSGGQWLYSAKSISLIRSYMQEHPQVFERLAKRVNNDVYTEDELFDESGPEKLSDVVDWIKEQPYNSVGRRSCNAIGLDPDTIERLSLAVDKLASDAKSNGKTVLMQVKPHLLYRPGLNAGNLSPDPQAQHKLFDRVVSTRESSTVPLGYKGTIVGIQNADDPINSTYDVLFDREFVGGISFVGSSTNRRYKLLSAEFINVSHGLRIEHNIASITSAIPGKQVAPAKSWRQQDSATSSAQNAHLIPVPTFMRKTDGTNNRSSQNFEAATKRNKQPQNSVKTARNSSKNATTVVESTNNGNANNSKSRNDGNSEFQILWNELHKTPSTAATTIARKSTCETNKIQPTSNDSLQDESAFLKAMLKISDENTTSSGSVRSVNATNQNNVKIQVAGSSTNASNVSSASNAAPPLVQKLFDQARQASRQENVSYCARLLRYCQLTGRGMPRFKYITNPQKMICAQIILSDMRTYCGEFCMHQEMAAESAAEVICKELRLDTVPIKPGLSILGAPPMMWLNSLHNDAQQPPPPPPPQSSSSAVHNVRPPPMMQPRSPQVFPNMHNPPMHMPQWNPRMQRLPAFPQAPNHEISQTGPLQNSTHIAPNNPEVLTRSNLNKPPADSKNKKNTPFVPLQAQKKTRNSKPKQQQQTSRNNPNQTPKERNHPPSTTQAKIQDDSPKQVSKEDKVVDTIERTAADTETKKLPQASQKVPRAPKPRRSRIAANFNSIPAAPNGSAPQ